MTAEVYIRLPTENRVISPDDLKVDRISWISFFMTCGWLRRRYVTPKFQGWRLVPCMLWDIDWH